MVFTLRAGSLVALATLLFACGGDEGADGDASGAAVSAEPDQSALRELIRAANAPPTAAEEATKETGHDTQIKTENGVSQECVYKHFTGTALYETLVSF